MQFDPNCAIYIFAEQSKGQNYCTESDACILKNSNFAAFLLLQTFEVH